MSWKNVEKFRPRIFRRRWSITQRLVITYTFSAITMLAITAWFVNWTLHSSLLKAEQDYIDDRIRVYRAIIEHSPDFLYFVTQDIEWQGSFVKFPQYYARILNDKCHTIIETIHMNELIPPERFPDPCIFTKQEQERSRAKDTFVYVGRNGRSYLLETYWTEMVQPQQRVAIQIAVDITSQERLIRTNQQRSPSKRLLRDLPMLTRPSPFSFSQLKSIPLRSLSTASARITNGMKSMPWQESQFPSSMQAEWRFIALTMTLPLESSRMWRS
ncbi:hypothetical protein [Pelotalea chapellei]|uniref:Uncharacterized protein n=1 Tax=Pelotalea chapellei TaxID=44671 RepID=A0ABS5UBK0_9BACT|nr:hypothetical protein [Pelotalea chapellei]MBT1073055.1 hypothetical protein [Pelotalea chapellei]